MGDNEIHVTYAWQQHATECLLKSYKNHEGTLEDPQHNKSDFWKIVHQDVRTELAKEASLNKLPTDGQVESGEALPTQTESESALPTVAQCKSHWDFIQYKQGNTTGGEPEHSPVATENASFYASRSSIEAKTLSSFQWNERHVQILLKYYKHQKRILPAGGKIIWKQIQIDVAKEILQLGEEYIPTPHQCRMRWKSMRKQYIKTLKSNESGAKKPKYYRYHDDFYEIYGPEDLALLALQSNAEPSFIKYGGGQELVSDDLDSTNTEPESNSKVIYNKPSESCLAFYKNEHTKPSSGLLAKGTIDPPVPKSGGACSCHSSVQTVFSWLEKYEERQVKRDEERFELQLQLEKERHQVEMEKLSLLSTLINTLKK